MIIRDLKLANANTSKTGEFYSLIDKKHYLSSPTGLGFDTSISTVRIGERESVTNRKYVRSTISGDLCFTESDNNAKYKAYSDFMEFIRFGELQLYYKPSHSDKFYFCDVELIKLVKSEISSDDGVLHCTVNFYALSTWKDSKYGSAKVNGNISNTDGKYYNLVRDYYYGSSSYESIEINNSGYLQVGFEIKIEGNCMDPTFYVYKDGSSVPYGKCKFIGNYGSVYINSKDGEEEVYLARQDGSVVESPISFQDMSLADGKANITFIKLVPGISQLKFLSDGFEGTIELAWDNAYMSV